MQDLDHLKEVVVHQVINEVGEIIVGNHLERTTWERVGKRRTPSSRPMLRDSISESWPTSTSRKSKGRRIPED